MLARFAASLRSGLWHVSSNHFEAFALDAVEGSPDFSRVLGIEDTTKQGDFLDKLVGPEPKASIEDGVAIIPLKGMMMRGVPYYAKRFFGIRDTAEFQADVEKAAGSSNVSQIVIVADSPGGSTAGIHEAALALRAARASKPVTVAVDGLLASAAYHIGAAANRIEASPSSIVGSIGTFLTLIDASAYHERSGIKPVIIKNKEGAFKAAGAFGTALSAKQREQLGDLVQSLHDQFRAFVNANRMVNSKAMQGQAFSSEQAKRAGLIDAISTPSETIARAVGN